MAITWDQLPLTPQQQQAMQYFASIAPSPGSTPVVPTASLSQAKGAMTWLNELRALIEPAMRGADYTKMYHFNENQKAYDQANP
jgi:hypothetical protein